MPELPEVESLKRKLETRLIGKALRRVTLRRADLRWPIPKNLNQKLASRQLVGLRRRSKYLLWDFEGGQTLIVHLGMSGRLFFTESTRLFDTHDHVLFDFDSKLHLRFRDPRRFGMVLICVTKELPAHKLFCHLGPEPLENSFSGDVLFLKCKKSRSPIKSFLMNAKVVVGVGNIYASEALFKSGIRPSRPACKITQKEAEKLCAAIKSVLEQSIEAGGTSFRDYVGANEEPGLHQLQLKVYGRDGKLCEVCHHIIKKITQTGRSSFYCPGCQR